MDVAVVWMLLVQYGCVLLWGADWLTQQSALVHWLVVGSLPPILAPAQMRPAEATR
jgi:hypothetical protein